MINKNLIKILVSFTFILFTTNSMAANETVEMLNKLGTNKNVKKYTALMMAVEKEQIDIMRFLINSGASLDICNNDGSNNLHIACRTNKKSLCSSKWC